MEGHSLVSPDVLARYAGDAAAEVAGVAALGESPLHRGRSVEISGSDGAIGVEVANAALHLGMKVEGWPPENIEEMAKKLEQELLG